jgi:hypothetical protein
MEPMYKTQQKKEGKVAKTIEEQTSKLPSDVFLWASVGAMTASLVLQLARQKHISLFIGQWAAPFLLFGIYNKLVKQLGHDKTDQD